MHLLPCQHRFRQQLTASGLQASSIGAAWIRWASLLAALCRIGWPPYIVGRSSSGGLTLLRLPSVLLRGVSSGGRGTVAADLLRRMLLPEPSLLAGVLCALRVSFAAAAAAALLPLIRDSEFLQITQTSVIEACAAQCNGCRAAGRALVRRS